MILNSQWSLVIGHWSLVIGHWNNLSKYETIQQSNNNTTNRLAPTISDTTIKQ